MKKNIFLSDILTKEEKTHLKKIRKYLGGIGNSFNQRIEYFKAIQGLLQKHGVTKDSCLIKHTGYYNIGNVLKLYNENTMRGAYGIVYRADVIDAKFLSRHPNKYPIVAKVMEDTDGNNQEVKLGMAISNNIIKESLSRHFLLCYKSFNCNNTRRGNSVEITKKKQSHNVDKYLVSLNELAEGDLRGLLKQMETGSKLYESHDKEEFIYNIVSQCILSIMTYNKLGWIHQDTHSGNFLYQKTDNTSGYYHYIIDGENYYLRNYGYTILLNDFGLSESYIPGKNPKYFNYWNKHFLKINYDAIMKDEVKKIDIEIKQLKNKDEISKKLEERVNKVNKVKNDYKNELVVVNNFEFNYEYNDYKRFLWVISNNISIQRIVYYKIISEQFIDYINDFFKLFNYNSFDSEANFIKGVLNTMVKNKFITKNISQNDVILNPSKAFIIDNTLREKMPSSLPEYISTSPTAQKQQTFMTKIKKMFETKK